MSENPTGTIIQNQTHDENTFTNYPPPTILGALLGVAAALLIGTGCADTDNTPPDDGSLRLTLAQTPDPDRPYARITADLWANNAAEVHMGLYGMNAETLLKSIEETGLTFEDYLKTYCSYLMPSALELANSADGFHYPFTGMSSGVECTLCAAAWNAEGECITQLCEFTAPVYPYLDGQTTWETVSTDATLECGFLKAMGGPCPLTINRLTVEKATGEEVYRIADLFSSVSAEVEASEHFTVLLSADPSYFIIDARDPGAVKIEPLESRIDLLHDWQYIHVGSGPLFGDTESAGMEYGTFDRQSGTLELGILAVQYWRSTGENTFSTELSTDSAPSRLRLHGNPE
ncbi:hypothetical protein [Alistipes sp.]|uniref:hypothetical protein n=1 Tax=Alistipes sp. TaxID=1872444 RepID=UPI004028CC6B